MCGFDFPPPHFFDGGEVHFVYGHGYPISLSKATIVRMPAAMRSTCRNAFASI
jgi:hypothetical protein